MTWYYNNEPVTSLPSDCVGFVYIITNKQTGRQYVGKKLAKFTKTTYRNITLKNGTKKRKRIRSQVDSDWATYYGSSDALTKDIQKLGRDQFHREILHYCDSKAKCSYLEAREQFQRSVLESDQYYNNQISLRVHGSHILNK